jgi:DUF1680 family protein
MTMQRIMTPVPFTKVTLEDSFWAPRMATNREVTLPREYELCELTGRIRAWDLAWQPGNDNKPHIFWDSDVAKWIEAASYSLDTHPDAQLDALLDRVIARIAAAQDPDGYLNSAYLTYEKHGIAKRWTNLRDMHELYCAGHLIEAAVAHYRATGKRTLLDPICRYVDYIAQVFGMDEGQLRGYCGHQEIELALVQLFHVTNERRYLDLALYFINERGQQPHYYDMEARARGEDPAAFWAKTYEYNQSHVPVREQQAVTGHAVRAMYQYAAMADLANETGDVALLEACERLWKSVCEQRMYITGGIGPSARNEGFTEPYDLPDESAYAETCAAVGMVFWNYRMLQFSGDGRYADMMERALYNGSLSGVSLDGQRFFYDNPLASRGNKQRSEWFDCACCPPNIARLIASIGGYFYATGPSSLWLHLYAAGHTRIQIGDTHIWLHQETNYPWDGAIRLALDMDKPARFGLHLRVPGWCSQFTLRVNGARVDAHFDRGYVQVVREWHAGDVITLDLSMPVVRMVANPMVRSAIGRVALQRGPLLYCLEGIDNPVVPLDQIACGPDVDFVIEHHPELLGGVTILTGRATMLAEHTWDHDLYRAQANTNQEPITITAIPYCVWANRGLAEMRVWLRER